MHAPTAFPRGKNPVTRAGLGGMDQTSQRHAPKYAVLLSHGRRNLKCSFETSVSTYQSTLRNITEDLNSQGLLYFQRHSAIREVHNSAKKNPASGPYPKLDETKSSPHRVNLSL